MSYRIEYIKTGNKDENGDDLYRIVCNGIEIDVQPWWGVEAYYPEWSIKLAYDRIKTYIEKPNKLFK